MKTVKQLEVDVDNFDDDYICMSDGYDGVVEYYKDENLDYAIKKLLQEQLEYARHIEQLESQIADLKKDDWVSCSDRLPEENQLVFVYYKMWETDELDEQIEKVSEGYFNDNVFEFDLTTDYPRKNIKGSGSMFRCGISVSFDDYEKKYITDDYTITHWKPLTKPEENK